MIAGKMLTQEILSLHCKQWLMSAVLNRICDDWKSTVLFLCDEFLEKAVRPVDSSTALVSFSVFHVTVLPLKHEKGLHIFCNLIQLNHF